MAHHDRDLSEPLDAVQSGDVTEKIRTSLQWVPQAPIEAEHEGHAAEPSGHEALQERDPRGAGLAVADVDAEDLSVVGGGHAYGDHPGS